MSVILANNATSLLAANLSSGATTLVVSGADAAKFPSPSGGAWCPITVFDTIGNMEIMRCTARSGANLTVTRAQEGTSAQSFTTGARVDCRFTAGALADIVALIASAVAAGVAPKLDSSAYTAADVLAKLLTVDVNDSGINATTVNGANLASLRDAAQLTGTLDPARIPVIATQKQVISAGATIAALSAPEQADVTGAGVVVTTTDGKRWIYKGSGSKTAEASYIEMGDVTPDWAAIANKPDATQSVAGLLTAGDKIIIDRGSRGHYGSVSSATLDATYLGKSITAATADHTITIPTVASLGGASGLVFGPIKVTGPILLTIAASGSDVLRFHGGATPTSIVLGLGQEVWLRSTGPTTWTIFGFTPRVLLSANPFTAASQAIFTFPPGYRKFEIDYEVLSDTAGQMIYGRMSTDGGATFISSANAYRRTHWIGGGSSSSGTNLANYIEIIAPNHSSGKMNAGRLHVEAPRDTALNTLVRTDGADIRWGFADGTIFFFAGRREVAEDNNAFQLYPQSGTMTGRATLWGVQN